METDNKTFKLQAQLTTETLLKALATGNKVPVKVIHHTTGQVMGVYLSIHSISAEDGSRKTWCIAGCVTLDRVGPPKYTYTGFVSVHKKDQTEGYISVPLGKAYSQQLV